jgi:hypothetical protein
MRWAADGGPIFFCMISTLSFVASVLYLHQCSVQYLTKTFTYVHPYLYLFSCTADTVQCTYNTHTVLAIANFRLDMNYFVFLLEL